jgi:hypothetical protein
MWQVSDLWTGFWSWRCEDFLFLEFILWGWGGLLFVLMLLCFFASSLRYNG